MSSLVPSGYYSVSPNNSNQLLELIRRLKGVAGDAGTAINNYGAQLPAGDLRKIALGADANTQMGLKRGLGEALSRVPGINKVRGMRMAMSPASQRILRLVPGLAIAGTAFDAADVIVGDESLANRAMDAAAMGIGGTLGLVGGPIGAATGASIGKMTSDGLQYLLGDRKTPEQRKLEEALMMLQGGRI